jgi:predicted MPP superfamily phosphohydrolase
MQINATTITQHRQASSSIPIILPRTGAEVILHLSDLHFGWEKFEDIAAHRKLALEAIFDLLAELPNSWLPTIICITGDIGYQGIDTDYHKAETWIRELCDKAKVPLTDLVLCPGNHDLFRDPAYTNFPQNATDADAVLRSKNHVLRSRFAEFEDFCKRLGIPPFQFGSEDSFLVGWRKLRNLNFISMNTAWFSRDHDQWELWMGQPHLVKMEGAGQLPSQIQKSEEVYVALAHHPPEWLHPSERAIDGSRPNTIDYLVERVDLLLTGHTHGELRKPNSIALSGYHLTSGATYGSNRHLNVLRLIQFEDEAINLRGYKLDPSSNKYRWMLDQSHGPYMLPEREVEPSITNCQIQMVLSEHINVEDSASLASAQSTLQKRLTTVASKISNLANIETAELGPTAWEFKHRVNGVCRAVGYQSDAPQGEYLEYLLEFQFENARLVEHLMDAAGEAYHHLTWQVADDIDVDELNAICRDRLGEKEFMHNSHSILVGDSKIPLGWHGQKEWGSLMVSIDRLIAAPPGYKSGHSEADLGTKLSVGLMDRSKGGFRYAHMVFTPRKLVRMLIGDFTTRQILQFLSRSK